MPQENAAHALATVCALSVANSAAAACIGAALRRERVASKKGSLLLILACALLGALTGARIAAPQGAPAATRLAVAATVERHGAGAAWTALPTAAFLVGFVARRYVLPGVEKGLARSREKERLHRRVQALVVLCGSFEAFAVGLSQASSAWAWAGVAGLSGRSHLALGSLAAGAWATRSGVRALGRMCGRFSLLDSAAASLLCGGLALLGAVCGVPAPLVLHSAAGVAGIAWERARRPSPVGSSLRGDRLPQALDRRRRPLPQSPP